MFKATLNLIFFSSLLMGCQIRPRKIDSINVGEFTETRLRSSRYLVKHPAALQLSTSEFYHKDQESTFSFCKKDSLPPYSNTFVIGLNVPDSVKSIGFDLPVVENVRSQVLGSVVNWNIRKSDTGYYIAEARLGEMKFLTTSVTPTGIDSMIACVSTLSAR